MRFLRWMKVNFPVPFTPIFVVIAILLVLIFVFRLYSLDSAAEGLKDVVAVLTFLAIVLYVYFTYQLAKAPMIPIICGQLRQDSQDKCHIWFDLFNKSKVNIDCWCKMTLIIANKEISVGGFYDGDHPAYVQAEFRVSGHFYLIPLITKAGETKGSLAGSPESQKIKIIVELAYERSTRTKPWNARNLKPEYPNTKLLHPKYWNPSLFYYFDLNGDSLVYDF